MNGTHQPDQDAERRKPSPSVAEVEARLRDIYANGAEPWNDPAEARRAVRRRDMEIMRLSAMEAALHTTEYICGRLPAWKTPPFEKVTDPIAALANLNRAIVQITLAEDRFDECAEARAARIKAEAEAKIRTEQAARADAERTLRRAENKRQAHGAIRAIALDYIHLPRGDREDLLANMFGIWEAEDAYDADPAETVADACAQLALTPRIVADAEIRTPDGQIDPAARRKRLLAVARNYIALIKPADQGDDDDENGLSDPAAPPARAQGPPH